MTTATRRRVGVRAIGAAGREGDGPVAQRGEHARGHADREGIAGAAAAAEQGAHEARRGWRFGGTRRG